MSETTARGDGVIVDRPATGTGTLPRPAPATRRAASARQVEAPRKGEVPRQGKGPRQGEAPRQQRTGPAREGTRQAPARPPRQRTTEQARPAAGAVPSSAIPAGLRRVSPAAANRMPFMVLLCGLLGGALVSALVISTTLADGSFEISKLQQSDDSLAQQRQELQDEVAQDQSAPVIEQRAYQLGMRPVGQLQFVNLKTGKIDTNAGSGKVTAINVPGYTP
ncbi:MAG TPA: hypothetical protein VGI96_11490 [Streptosporangiaceae bacterium]